MWSFFKNYPFPSLILNSGDEFRLAGLNNAYRNAFGSTTKENDLIGESIFRLFPEGEAILKLRQALEGVAATHKPQKAIIPIQESASDKEKADSRLLVLTPALNDQGELDVIICSFHPLNNDISTENKLTQPHPHLKKQDEQGHQQNPEIKRLQKRLKEKSCLYKISSLNEQQLSVEELLEKAVHILPQGWQHTGVTEAAIEYGGKTFTSGNYMESGWVQSTKAEVRPGNNLTVTVAYLEERSFYDEGLFLNEERELIESVADHLARKLNQKHSQQQLKEKQVLLDKAYKLAHIGIWEFDMQTHDLQWSDVTKEIHGFGPDYKPDVESTINLFKEGINRQKFAEAARAAIEEEESFDVELKIVSGQGDERWIRATAEPEYKNGICTRFYGISQNVTDRRKAEEDLLLNEQRFRSLVQDGSDLLAILDSEANYRYVSPTSKSILGLPAEDFIGTNALEYIHPEDHERIIEIIDKLTPGERCNIAPFRFRNAEGNWRWIETTLINMTEDAAVGGLVANSRDVTKQIRQQQRILEALKEKETLLSEIHHRVKNNLAVVSGMIQLQISDADNRELTERLQDSIVRIKTMAGIHEQLYQSKSFSELEFADNIRLLIYDIQETMQANTKTQIDFDCEPVQLNINQAIPCSLIVNEVVTNIFKHAFPGRDQGKIGITLSESTNRLHLCINDDGIGLPQNFNDIKSNSLGLNLIDVLSQQLEATYHFNSAEEGTTFDLRFEKDNQKGIGNSFL